MLSIFSTIHHLYINFFFFHLIDWNWLFIFHCNDKLSKIKMQIFSATHKNRKILISTKNYKNTLGLVIKQSLFFHFFEVKFSLLKRKKIQTFENSFLSEFQENFVGLAEKDAIWIFFENNSLVSLERKFQAELNKTLISEVTRLLEH